MQYIDFGKTSLRISRFGMGCMRLPQKKDAEGHTVYDWDESIRMIRYAVENGVNYFDTARVYCNNESEPILGKALAGGLREKVHIATKVHPRDYWRIGESIDEQIERLQTDYIDFFLLHCVNRINWDNAIKYGCLDTLQKYRDTGKIRYIGFSFHDSVSLFKRVIDSFEWDMCMFQLSYMDQKFQAGIEGMMHAASKGIPVVIMEPLKGGALADRLPDRVKEHFDKSGSDWSPAEWAFRWLADLPQVSVVLSGVSTMEQLDDNIRIFDTAKPNSLTGKEREIVNGAKKIYESMTSIPCTSCGYCSPCPSGVEMISIFKLFNDFKTIGTESYCRAVYDQMKDCGSDASACIECGQCESACPQGIEIIQRLKDADKLLAKS